MRFAQVSGCEDDIITVVATLPSRGTELLVDLPDGFWIDSLRTE